MSSVHRALSQVAPLKRYVASGTGQLLNASGANLATVASGTVLRDMGKTVHLTDGTVLRKVQALPVATGVSNSGVTGYIKLGDGSVSGQNIISLN